MKVLLIILDGWGLSPLKEGNATYLAKTPNLDWIYGNYPKTSISASGISVGITPGEVGNSEVGHLNLGSGRVVWENLPRIDQAIEKGDFSQNENLLKIAQQVKNAAATLHLIGLCSQGGVHSCLNHLFALLKFARDQNIARVFIQMITDGRDTAPQATKDDIAKIQDKISEIGVGKIATIIGRFYAMDRDRHFERISKAYNLWVAGVGERYSDPAAAIEANYQNGVDDEKIDACLIDQNGLIKAGDGIVFFNFRSDRMRQILESFESENFSEFQRQKVENLAMVSMTKYFDRQKSALIFPPLNMANVLSDVIENAGFSQCHIAETEKYAHVTYFFNGGEEQPHKHESQILVPSPRVESYAEIPQMSAPAVKDKVLKAISANLQFILVNFANGDMVGHTGNLQATIQACEAVDSCLGEILSLASSKGITAIITADHGNCELMINPQSKVVSSHGSTPEIITDKSKSENKEISKEHTSNPVPFVLLDLAERPFTPQSGTNFNQQILLEYSSSPPTGILADVAPTILSIMAIPKPEEMGGIDLSALI